MNYIQLGIAVWLELARRRARKAEDSEAADMILELLARPEDTVELLKGKDVTKLTITEYLADVAEDILKAVKP